MKSTEVVRIQPVETDLGNLALFDYNPIESASTTSTLKQGSRDSVQLLINAIFALPSKSTIDGIFACLPDPTTIIPREKPIPKVKDATKWEKFAKEKGILNKKKSRMKYDDATDSYKPSWGYKSKENDSLKDWVIELPDNHNPEVDPRQEIRNEKKARVEKNKKQQSANVSRASGSSQLAQKKIIESKLAESKMSTASLGKFDKILYKEPKMKLGVKRKFESVTDKNEGARVGDIVKKIAKKTLEGSVSIEKAVKKVDARKIVKQIKEKETKDRKPVKKGRTKKN